MAGPISYLKEVREEISKVTWPKRQEVVRLTLIVIIFSSVVGGYLGLLDYSFTQILGKILTR